MHVILAGASGLIGSALAEALGTQANRVTRLVRRAPRTADEVQWEPGRVSLDPRALEGADAVVALGGASIGKLPWSEAYRKQILDSRVIATRTIADALEALGVGGGGHGGFPWGLWWLHWRYRRQASSHRWNALQCGSRACPRWGPPAHLRTLP